VVYDRVVPVLVSLRQNALDAFGKMLLLVVRRRNDANKWLRLIVHAQILSRLNDFTHGDRSSDRAGPRFTTRFDLLRQPSRISDDHRIGRKAPGDQRVRAHYTV